MSRAVAREDCIKDRRHCIRFQLTSSSPQVESLQNTHRASLQSLSLILGRAANRAATRLNMLNLKGFNT